MSTAAAALLPATLAHAQSGTSISYNIPAGKLSTALTRWAQASGVKLLAPATALQNLSTGGLTGSHSPQSALATLLAGTGLSYTFTGSTVTISTPGAGGNGGTATVDGAVALDTIDVSGGGISALAEAPFQTPGSTSYVSAEQLSRVPQSSVADIFKGVPGVISGNGRNGAALDVNIRGMQGMNRVKTTVDGAEQSTSSYRGYFGVDNRTFVDQDFIGGIEIGKGPGTSAASAGAPGGVVAITTLTADDILLPGLDYGVRIKGTRTSNGIDPVEGMPFASARSKTTDLFDADGGSGSFAAAARGEHIEIVAAYSRRQTGNYFTGTNGPTHYRHPAQPTFPREYSYVGRGMEAYNTSKDVESGLLKANLKWQAHSLQLGYIYYDNRYGEITPTIAQSGGQRPLSHTNVKNATAKYRYNPLDNDLIDFRVNLWHTEALDEANYFSLFSTSRAPTQSTMKGGDISNTSRIGAFKFTYGASISYEESEAPPGINPALIVIGERQTGSTYINGEWRPLDWLKLNAGGKYEFYEVNSAWGDREGGEFSPSASITFIPWQGIQLFSSYAEGIRPATIRETASGVGNTRFNPALKPERSKSFEVGLNADRRGVLFSQDVVRAKLAYFNTTVDDYIFRDAPPGGGSYDFWAFNLDRAKFSGIELQFSYDARRFFAEFGATYYDTVEFCRVGQPCLAEDLYRPVNRTWDYSANHVPPEFMVTATLGARFFDEALTVGTRVTHATARKIPPSPIDVSTAVVWAPFTVVDLFASYKLNENLTFNVSAENLADKFYVDPLGGTPIAAPGRTIHVGFTAKF
jgi:hemoglobin/transferrin/lactoferrin receptor protein